MAKDLNDGTPYDGKLSCTVWVGGKVRDSIKYLPINIILLALWTVLTMVRQLRKEIELSMELRRLSPLWLIQLIKLELKYTIVY